MLCMECYGVETWTVLTTLEKRLEALKMWLYRKMLKLSWTEEVKNEEVLQRMNEKRTISDQFLSNDQK